MFKYNKNLRIVKNIFADKKHDIFEKMINLKLQ
jgi:hypothetical protein